MYVCVCNAVTERDYVSRDILQENLDDTEEHIYYLQTQLDIIYKIGLQNYLQTQMVRRNPETSTSVLLT